MISGVGELKQLLVPSPVQPQSSIIRLKAVLEQDQIGAGSYIRMLAQHIGQQLNPNAALEAATGRSQKLLREYSSQQTIAGTCMPSQKVGHVPQLAVQRCWLLLQPLHSCQGHGPCLRGLDKDMCGDLGLVQLVV